MARLERIDEDVADDFVSWGDQLRAEGRLEGRREGRLEGRREGRLEGRLEGERVALSALLVELGTARFGNPDPAARGRLHAATTEDLRAWARRIADATSWDDLLA